VTGAADTAGPPGDAPICRIFHEETKYVAGRMDKFNVAPGWRQTPSPFKDYHTEHAVDLVGYLPFDRHPFTGGPLPPAPAPPGSPGVAEIARLLYFANGVTAILPLPDGNRHYFRAAPSAGALYPTETYVAVRDVPGLPDGIYNHLVRDHALVPVWEGDCWDRLLRYTAADPAVDQARVVLLYTAIWGRSQWRYLERAYRRMLLDTGHVLGNSVCVAPRLGFGAFPVGGFLDGPLNQLLLLDEADEAVLALLALPRLDAVDLDRMARNSTWPSPTPPGVPPDPAQDLSHQLHRASSIPAPPDREPSGPDPEAIEHPYADADEVIPLDHEPIEWEGGLESAILERRSARRFGRAPMPLEHLAAMLSYAYQPAAAPAGGRDALRQLFDPSLLFTYVLVHDVPPLEPGVYYYVPARHELRLVRRGDFRHEAHHFCLEQDLGRDAAALVIHTTHLARAVARHGDRAYRYLHLDAGHVGERLGLAAVGLGLGASGIGGFYDNEVTRLIGDPEQDVVAYITTLGPQPARE
jgi:SagB-type dehydrogenase family enzyme